MTTLTLKIGDRLTIGNVTVVVQRDPGHHRVKLVIEAPRRIKVLRGEEMGDLTLQQHTALLSADL